MPKVRFNANNTLSNHSTERSEVPLKGSVRHRTRNTERQTRNIE